MALVSIRTPRNEPRPQPPRRLHPTCSSSLHEELGLPERKTISLTPRSISTCCNGADAQHLIETLEDHFAIDFVDFDSYRYFQPEGYDVFLKRKAKGRGEKEPLTIGMLYRAIKAQRWDTRELEGL